MAEQEGNPLFAAVRYYGDKSNKVHLIDPALIQDFVSVDTFNVTIPHLVNTIHGGQRIQEPAQVFAISDNKQQLLEPPRRRIFENKRRSDVLLEILDSDEKPEKKKKSTRDEDQDTINADASKDANLIVSTKQTKAQELKAIEKRTKDDAKAFAKSIDNEIMAQKIEVLKRNKLIYTQDVTEIQNKQKEINDMKMALEMQRKEFEEMKAKYERENETMQKNCQKSKELLEKCRQVIYTLQNQKENTIQNIQTKETEESAVVSGVLEKNARLFAEEVPLRDVTNLDYTSDLNVEDIAFSIDMTLENVYKQPNSEGISKNVNDKPEGSGSRKDDATVEQYLQLEEDGSLDQGYSPSEKESNDHLKTDKKKKKQEDRRQKHRRVKARQQQETSDEEINYGNESPQEKTEKVQRNKMKSFEGNKKSKKPTYVPTKKYGDIHSTSQSDSDSDDGRKKGFSRQSDDEYASDNFEATDRPNYTSYQEETGKKRRMYHLKHGIAIKRDVWDELNKIFDVREWIRVLIHAMFKEEELIDKVFKIQAAKPQRLPGRTRNEFTLEERDVMSTFFCRVDRVVKRRKTARAHKHNWKSYIRKKREMQKKRKAKVAGRKICSSTSSSDNSEAIE